MNACFKSIAVLLISTLIALTACNNNETIISFQLTNSNE